eukprot:7925838-Pyramimonas_sp.AAC.1
MRSLWSSARCSASRVRPRCAPAGPAPGALRCRESAGLRAWPPSCTPAGQARGAQRCRRPP